MIRYDRRSTRGHGTVGLPVLLAVSIVLCSSLQGRPDKTLLDAVLASPNPGNVALLADRAGFTLGDALPRVVRHLKEAKTREDRRKILKAMRLIVDHEKLLKAVEARFQKATGRRATVRDSRYYRVMSTADEVDMKLAQDHMDAIHTKYRADIFKHEDKPEEKFILILLRNAREYKQLTGSGLSIACYVPRIRSLVCSIPQDRKDFSAFYHEGFHQFFHYYYPNIPAWLDEGFATYFEVAELKFIRSGRSTRNFDFIIGKINPSRLLLTNAAVELSVETPLPEFFGLTYREFSSAEPVQRGSELAAWLGKHGYRVSPRLAKAQINYAQAWSVVHFLIHGSGSGKGSFLRRYLKALRDGKLPDEANRELFAKVKPERFHAAWTGYVKRQFKKMKR